MKYLLVMMLSFNALAQDVVTIKKGDPAPFDGVLFTKERELALRKDILEKEFLEKRVSLLGELGKVQSEELSTANIRITNYRIQVAEYADREVKSESRDFLKNSLYFVAGALITGAIGYGVLKTYK